MQRVGGIVHQLGIVKGIVYLDVSGAAGCTCAQGGGGVKISLVIKVSINTHFALLANGFVMSPLHSHNT